MQPSQSFGRTRRFVAVAAVLVLLAFVATLASNVHALNDDVTRLTATNATLRKQATDLQTQVDSLTKELDGAQRRWIKSEAQGDVLRKKLKAKELIPSFVGLPLILAKTAISYFGWRLGAVKEQASAQTIDTVLAQSPRAGTLMKLARKVTLTIAKAPNVVMVVATCSGRMANAFPGDGGYVTVVVSSNVLNSTIVTVAHYKTTSTEHDGRTNSSGSGSVTFSIGRPTVGYTVVVSISVGRASCSTSFTPQ